MREHPTNDFPVKRTMYEEEVASKLVNIIAKLHFQKLKLQ